MDGRSQARAVKDSAQGAMDAAAEAGRTVKDMASDAGRTAMDAAAEAGTRARNATQYAAEQATAAVESAYDTGSVVADMVQGAVRQNPWASLVVALAAGYGIACLVKQQRR